MNAIAPDIRHLFAQLGEPTDDEAINRFIARHLLLGGATVLHEAAFWTRSQSAFLREAIDEDADWAPVVDQLNTRLHHPSHPI